MRIQEVRERSIPLSRYAGVAAATGGLSTSLVAVLTDIVRDGRRVVGYGHASVGRYAQGGLIRERFAPRLLGAPADSLASDDGSGIDPLRAWDLMMRDEKPGGHGERCVAVGALDMALWDAAAKAAGLPLHRFLARRLGLAEDYPQRVPVYAGGGYPYPHDDLGRLEEELRRFVDLGYTHAKIKIGAAGLDQDRRRIDRALRVLDDASRLAVDAMNRYDAEGAVDAAKALAPLGLWWFEDSGLRRERDVLVFDPVHCYGLPGYLAILDHLCARGWPRAAFRPHAGYLFSLHLVAALRLGWAEATPSAFRPFDDFAGALPFSSGLAGLPQSPGIGFERQATLAGLFRKLLEA
ncbi:mandelate racemase [Pseudomonas aeruginosa]|nr:mandelate racemase [Pseudomonas aeruginosa]HBO1227251.1 mandelate racemase [Pseudomonas aeruginosa]